MNAAAKTVNYEVSRDEYSGMASKVLDTVRLLGVDPSPTKITVNGNNHSNFTVLPSKEVLVRGLGLTANQNFVLQYE